MPSHAIPASAIGAQETAMIRAAIATAMLIVLAAPAFAQTKRAAAAEPVIKLHVEPPVKFDLVKMHTGPSPGYVNWCHNTAKGKMKVDINSERCTTEGASKPGNKICPAICIDSAGKKIEEPGG